MKHVLTVMALLVVLTGCEGCAYLSVDVKTSEVVGSFEDISTRLERWLDPIETDQAKILDQIQLVRSVLTESETVEAERLEILLEPILSMFEGLAPTRIEDEDERRILLRTVRYLREVTEP